MVRYRGRETRRPTPPKTDDSLERQPDLPFDHLGVLNPQKHGNVADDVFDKRLADVVRSSRRVNSLEDAKSGMRRRVDRLDDERVREQLRELRSDG